MQIKPDSKHLVLFMVCIHVCPEASVVHASGSGQLQANPHVAGLWLSLGKSSRKAVTTMGSNDLVVDEDHMLGPICQRYTWQKGRCDPMAFGSSPRRGKTLNSNPAVLRKYPLVEMTSGDNLKEKSGVEPLKAV